MLFSSSSCGLITAKKKFGKREKTVHEDEGCRPSRNKQHNESEHTRPGELLKTAGHHVYPCEQVAWFSVCFLHHCKIQEVVNIKDQV